MLKMIDPDQALATVVELAPGPIRKDVRSVADAVGFVLAEEVVADRAYPPFDRAMMDGYAVCVADAGRSCELIGEVRAGQDPCSSSVEPGRCVAVMTGAPCPRGTEAVVKKELVSVTEGATARVDLPPQISAGQDIVRRGAERSAGQTLLATGTVLSPLAIGVLATVGLRQVQVFAPPRLAVITTGDELAEAEQSPGAQQIRDSNGPMIAALARRAGVEEVTLLHATDTEQSLQQALERGADAEIIVLSGGVSAGRYDLVPAAVAAFGAELLFHKVTQKPGKPLLFARRGSQLIFGLPGNPVSGHFCFHRYVTAAVRKQSGRDPVLPTMPGRLSCPLVVSSGRTLFVQARVAVDDRGWLLTPLLGQGSADLFAGVDAMAYLRLDPGDHRLDPGAPLRFEWLMGEPTR